MSRISKFICISLVALLLVILLAYNITEVDKSDNPVQFKSFRDIPGITEYEIQAIEKLKEQYSHFVYGSVPSTEAFQNENGELGG